MDPTRHDAASFANELLRDNNHNHTHAKRAVFAASAQWPNKTASYWVDVIETLMDWEMRAIRASFRPAA